MIKEEQKYYFLIYRHKCTITNKSYIGQRKYKCEHTPEYAMLSRWNEHCSHTIKRNSKLRFHQKILKYGKENFEHEVIESMILDQNDANLAEIYWINWYNTKIPFGYNLTFGGAGTSGHKQSKEACERKRQALKGRKRSLEERKNISEANKGRVPSKESNEKRSKAMKGRKKSDETIQNMKIAQKIHYKNNPITQITKDKLSIIFSHPVIKYSLEGIPLSNYCSIDDAEKHSYVNRTSISRACIMNISDIHYPRAGGYIWRYSNENISCEQILLELSKREQNKKNYKENRVHKSSRAVKQYDMI